MRQVLDGIHLREIDQLANELRRSQDTEDTFQGRRIKIFELYMAGIQTREAILAALHGDEAASLDH